MKSDVTAPCRFFTAGDACRLALAAYYAAGHRIEPPAGEPWIVDGDPYAGPADFADAFNGELQARLSLLALDRLGDFNVLCSEWDLCMLAADVEPEKMHRIISIRETEMAEVEARFIANSRHDLPGVSNALHNQDKGSAGNADQ